MLPRRYGVQRRTLAYALTGGILSAHALNGLRVLEVGNYIAGPYCGTLLADLGAEVTKVEDPNGGDVVRTYGAMFDDATDSATFLTLNRNKRSLALDLKSEDGKKIFMTLAAGADVSSRTSVPGP
ncbi:MAG: putative acyl-CoA transferase/carnitine dehydratase [Mycobacterium sp.]|nr:putative acyl-CoA transferase/carnitine dehydratase [Mycobacterium sp.]